MTGKYKEKGDIITKQNQKFGMENAYISNTQI